MSERTTWSPSDKPPSTSMVFTELRPSCTCVRAASPVAGSNLNRPTVLCSWPNAGRPTNKHVVEPLELDRAVDAQVRDARRAAARRSSSTSTVTVPCCAAGSMRMTRALDDAVARVDFAPSGRW